MNFYSTLRRCMILLLLNVSVQRCPLSPAGCKLFKELGNVTVEPAPIFLMGSSLTVSCHVRTCQWGYKITLELNGEAVKDRKDVNCNTAIFNLPVVRVPLSIVICKLRGGHITKIVNGLDLHGGFPPDKPADIVCETSRSSDFIDCSWRSGTETHISTTYNISVNRENGTLIYFDQIKDAKAIKIPQRTVDENTKYQLIITAYNQLGAAQSDPFILCVKDTVIPDTPRISSIAFADSPIAAVLQWETTSPSVNLRPYIRLRTMNGSWEARNETELGEGSIRVDDLRPLSEYEFQVRTCNVTLCLTSCVTATNVTAGSTASKKTLCSKWSPTVTGRSPGKGPSQQLQAWRKFHSPQMVTVLWKPPPPEDHSGEVLRYKIVLSDDQEETLNCSATLNHCLVQVPAELQALSISAVTLYGFSPPADVPLRHSGESGPVLRKLAPAANGSAVLVSWSWPESTPGGELLLHYVVEWISVPATELQWQQLDKDQNHTFITGLTAGVRYNVSVYAVTTRGVSESTSGSAYSKEQKPMSGPNLLVLNHEARQILIQWDMLPVHQQRGFITNYTLYIQTLDSSNEAVRVTVSGSGPRRVLVDCPEGALVLQLTASTSAGEGPRGGRTVSQPADPAASWLTLVVLIITLAIAVMANLMCWSCVRGRVKEKCFSWGPAWLDENLPKLGNSNAIKLLQQDRRELSFMSADSDPLLSPISLVSWEERDVYPTVHVSQTAVETPLDTRTTFVDSQLHHVGYKPQIAVLASQGDEAIEEEAKDIPANGDEDVHSNIFGNVLGGLLSSVEVDFSDSPLGHTLSTSGDLLQPKTPETAAVLNRDISVGRTGTGSEGEAEGSFPEADIRTTADMEDTCLSQCTAETTLTDGYFPQVAAVSSTTVIQT